jgi:hypothetical protein
MLTHCANDGDNKARSPGRARRKPLKPLRREGRVASGEPVVTNSCAFYLAHEAAGASGARSSLRPRLGERLFQDSGGSRREIAKARLSVIASDSEAIQYFSPGCILDCVVAFAPRNDGHAGRELLPPVNRVGPALRSLVIWHGQICHGSATLAQHSFASSLRPMLFQSSGSIQIMGVHCGIRQIIRLRIGLQRCGHAGFFGAIARRSAVLGT